MRIATIPLILEQPAADGFATHSAERVCGCVRWQWVLPSISEVCCQSKQMNMKNTIHSVAAPCREIRDCPGEAESLAAHTVVVDVLSQVLILGLVSSLDGLEHIMFVDARPQHFLKGGPFQIICISLFGN